VGWLAEGCGSVGHEGVGASLLVGCGSVGHEVVGASLLVGWLAGGCGSVGHALVEASLLVGWLAGGYGSVGHAMVGASLVGELRGSPAPVYCFDGLTGLKDVMLARTLTLAIVTTFSVPVWAAPPAAKAPPKAAKIKVPPHRFEAATAKTIGGFLDQLEKELGAMLRAEPNDIQPEKPLQARAYDVTKLATMIKTFRDGAGKIGATRVKLNGIEVRATLWHHRIPMRDVEFYFWRTGPSSFEVLRLLTDRSFHTYFGGPEIITHKGAIGVAAGKLAGEMVGLIRDQKCDAVPTVEPKFLEPFLPREEKAKKQVLYAFHKARFRTKTQCRSLRGIPFTHMTYRVGDVGGIVLDKAGERYSFKLGLAARKDAERSLGLLAIIKPVAPGSGKGGPRLKFKRKGAKTPNFTPPAPNP